MKSPPDAKLTYITGPSINQPLGVIETNIIEERNSVGFVGDISTPKKGGYSLLQRGLNSKRGPSSSLHLRLFGFK
jgi:hypothetical protein